MRTHLLAYADAIRASYWFIPALMSLLAVAMSFLTTTVDVHLGSDWLEDISWLHANKPAGARIVLSTIAGSMITVAGVVFSITIATVSYASAQYGPRLLTNFMRNRGNQFSLGMFIATFIYCLLVIRTIRSADEVFAGLAPDQETAFTPNIAVIVGIGLALSSIAVLIYFVHHVARSIHISHVVADIGYELRDQIAERFPEAVGVSSTEADTEDFARDDLPRPFRETADDGAEGDEKEELANITAGKIGFVQAIDADALIDAAAENDLVVRLECHPGDFLQESTAILSIWPKALLTDHAVRPFRNAIIVGDTRTPVQDVLFLVDQLVEIGTRALSPGVNDPFTAKNSLDWLGAAISYLSGRALPDPYRFDNDGNLRVIAYPKTFDDFIAKAFGQMTPYVSRDVNVSIHMLDTLAQIARTVHTDAERRSLGQLVSSLVNACQENLFEADRSRVVVRSRSVRKVIERAVPTTYQAG